jgi:hypothetical protein
LLAKRPSERPGANEVRHVARGIAVELAADSYAELEISQPRLPIPDVDIDVEIDVEIDGLAPTQLAHAPRAWPDVTPSDEVVVVDPETLETGNTEMLPVVAKPRWTPPLGRTIVPKAARDQIAGEIVCGTTRSR